MSAISPNVSILPKSLSGAQALARQGSNGRTRLSDTEFATPSLAGRKADTFTTWGGIPLKAHSEGVQ